MYLANSYLKTGLSDVSVSVVDGVDEKNHVEVEKINSEIEETINQIKEVFDSRPDELYILNS